MKNCELAEFGSLGARHADHAAHERHVGELRLQVGIFRAAGAVAVLPVAGLRHEAGDHAVERHVVVEAVARQLLDALGVLRRDVVAQLDDDAAVFGVEQHGVLRIEPGRQLHLRESGRGADERDDDSENADHSIDDLPGLDQRLARNFFFSRAATSAGTKAETSPPMPAIWRTNVAVIGRAAGEAGRNTLWMPGAIASFMPAICIS